MEVTGAESWAAVSEPQSHRDRRSEIGGQKSEVGGQTTEGRGQHFGLRIVDCGFGFASYGCAVVGDRAWGIGHRESETSETRGRARRG